MPGKILFMEPITLLSGKFFQNKREHIDRFIDQLLHMADIFLRKRYGLNTIILFPCMAKSLSLPKRSSERHRHPITKDTAPGA